ncbi:hypothetical protein GCM10012275_04350 [Longimycelium tulufanense]|uniref:Uncharacterized protein n=1 Tax=Longimycelium tulufanense TaxID=907463 RepID=A0A8J3C7M1_9PSEU|nr:hypothetical protein [Longimycelium tulufanense]GGM36261.1 hypothetical protein GCM10012275_04350 [Longimycelium tulufanense]
MAEDVPLTRYFPTPADQATRLEAAGFRVRLLQYVDRPTPLANCAAGAADWWRMMGPSVLSAYPRDRVDELLAEVNNVLRETWSVRTRSGQRTMCGFAS